MSRNTRSPEDFEGALAVFRAYGIDPIAMTLDELRIARREIARRSHPDHGGDLAQMIDVNVAYDTLARAVRSSPSDHGTVFRAETARKPEKPVPATPARTPEGAVYTPPPLRTETVQSGQPTLQRWTASGGRFSATQAQIRSEDFTDRNFIRKSLYERSRGTRFNYHVQAFDGASFTGLLLNGSEDAFPLMVEALSILHKAETKRDPCAVIIRDIQVPDQARIWILGPRPTTVPFSLQGRSMNDPMIVASLDRIVRSVKAG